MDFIGLICQLIILSTTKGVKCVKSSVICIWCMPPNCTLLSNIDPICRWGLDFIGEIHPSSSKGHWLVLVTTDYFT
jgi:hypothetical protein